MSEVAFIFAHLVGGLFAFIGTCAIVMLVAGFHLELDWDEYDLDDEDDSEEHF